MKNFFWLTTDKLRIYALVIFYFFLKTGITSGQVSPPGLSGTKLVGWGAVGVNQAFGKQWSGTFYVGAARMSDPDSWSVMKKQAIGVYNQEFQYKFNKKWQVSFAQSFRYQNEYEKEKPYVESNPSYRYELRYYGRIYYRYNLGKAAVNYTFRPEIRTFYEPGWMPEEIPLELRFRIRAQISVPINEAGSSQIVTGNEILTALDEYKAMLPSGHHEWSRYHFTEDRFHLYFKHIFSKPHLAVNVGIMEQFKTSGHFTATSYLAVDLQFQNPFSHM